LRRKSKTGGKVENTKKGKTKKQPPCQGGSKKLKGKSIKQHPRGGVYLGK